MRKKRNYWTKEIAFKKAREFNNKRDFKKKYVAAYELLRKNGWLDDACGYMINIAHPIKWTYVKCKEEALKYKTKREFNNNCSWGYVVAKQNEWLDDITSHMIKYKRVTPIHWTKEICQEEANKYQYRIDFSKKSSKAYMACSRNGWLDEICQHMEKSYVKSFKWSKEKCGKIAIKYNYRKEFQCGNKKAYSAARHNGWLDEICGHMKFKKLPNKYWHNFDNCKNEALKYLTKTDFVRNSQHVYSIALKNGWINKICEHMIPIGDRYNKCIYSYEFSDNHVYVGLTYNIDVRENSRKKNIKDAVIIHINKTNLTPIRKQLTEYIPVDEAIKLEEHFLSEYIKNGWIALNRRKTGSIGSSSSVWNINRMKKIASNYNNLNDFKNNELELFKIAERSGWLQSFYFK